MEPRKARDRKRMLRALINDITIAKGREPRQLLLQIRWQGGTTEAVELALLPMRPDAVRYPQGIVARIRQRPSISMTTRSRRASTAKA